MSLQLVMMIGNDQDKMLSLQEAIVEEAIVGCQCLTTLEGAESLVEKVLPDLLLIFSDSLEAVGENVNHFCLMLRENTSDYRPVIVVHTGTQEEGRRIDYLRDGADDILASDLSVEEVRIRLLVHLRRNLDVLSNRITRVPGLMLSAKFLQRKINLEESWALIMIEFDHFDVYCESYGHAAGEQVLRTFAAMLGAVVLPPDFIGHIETQTFSVVSHPDKAEKIAAILCRQFETVTPNFYSDVDNKRGYLISLMDEKVSRRVGLLSLSIGIVSAQTHPYDSYQGAFTGATVMKNLARTRPGNSWMVEKFQLTGQQQVCSSEKANILIVESDAALAYLLQATLEMENYEVDAVSSSTEAEAHLANKPYHLVLMDSLINGEAIGWQLCQRIKAQQPDIFIIFLSTLHDRDQALGAGADFYLPKPFELVPLFSWIHRLLRGI
jgi:DNA-binding response OmpR family regulator